MGTIHGFWASSQASAICAGVAPLLSAMRTEQVDHRLVGRAGLGGEPGQVGADVARRRTAVRLVDAPGEEPAAERAERHQADAELVQDRDDLLFGFAPEQRVLALQRGDRLHGVGAADGAHAGLGQAEVADLARLDEFLDGAGDVLDRHLRVDAVLVQQVDPVGAEPPQRAVHGVADVVGWLDSPVWRPSASKAKPNLVAMTTWSRTGASASPTSSSLTNGP